MKKMTIPSTNKVNNLQVYIFETADKPKAIFQISHGMQEHIMRYADFAEFLVTNGIMVIGNDHLGHGLTVRDKEELGYFGSEHSKTVVDDLYEVTKYAKSNYGSDIPYFLLGHSMGSFMARRYLMTYGSELTGAIISGTGSQPSVALSFGRLLASITGLIKGEKYRPAIVKKIAFGSYNKRIKDLKTEKDWLSKDEKILRAYESDELCQFDFTVDGYKTLFESISYIQKKENINRIPKNLPILFFSGTEDPVGNYGKGVEKAYDDFYQAGITNTEMVLYHDGRHEMLNEVEREGVYGDVLLWITNHIKKS